MSGGEAVRSSVDTLEQLGPVLIETKLRIPDRPELVRRAGVVARLADGADRALVLVAASAGYGKTTALAEWATRDAERGFAWLSLDGHDDEPVRFWTYLIEALRRIAPTVGARSLPILHAPGTDVLDDVVVHLLNELTTVDRALVIVLDDYHLITCHEIHAALTYLVEHTPPTLQVVVSTRSDPPLPLARLRARGDLLDLRAADLAFSRAEVDALLNNVVGLGLDDAGVGLVHSRTEGWPAGVYLAALSMLGHPDRREFLTAFAGDDRHVVDYLGEEVLAVQPPPVRSFLLRTSVLERLSAPLCDAVTAQDRSRELLDTIERANLFLVRLDDKRAWYRYHHLFADLLRYELEHTEPSLRPELHRRAAGWYRDAGLAADALRHTLAAGDPAAAAELIASRWISEFLGAGGDATVDGWLRALPEATLRGDVRLCIALAYVSLSLGRYDASARWIDAAEHAPQPAPFQDGFPSADAARHCVRAAYLYHSGDVGAAVGEARRAEPLTQGWPCHSLAVGARGLALMWLGDTDEAEEAVLQYSQLGAASGDRLGHLQGLGAAALIRARVGDHDRAENWARESLRLSQEYGTEEHWATSTAQQALAWVLARSDGPRAAERLVTRAVELVRRGAARCAQASALVDLAELRHRRGDPVDARALLREARGLVDRCRDPGMVVADLERAERAVGRQVRTGVGGVEELSSRELAVLRLLPTPMSQREIGAALYISLNTVKSHCRSVFRKLEVASRTAAVDRARNLGLLTAPSGPPRP